jgi:hypothetical protein
MSHIVSSSYGSKEVYGPHPRTKKIKRVGWFNIPCGSSDLCCMDYQDIWPTLFLGLERVVTNLQLEWGGGGML